MASKHTDDYNDGYKAGVAALVESTKKVSELMYEHIASEQSQSLNRKLILYFLNDVFPSVVGSSEKRVMDEFNSEDGT